MMDQSAIEAQKAQWEQELPQALNAAAQAAARVTGLQNAIAALDLVLNPPPPAPSPTRDAIEAALAGAIAAEDTTA